MTKKTEEKTKALKNSILYVFIDETSTSASIIKEGFEKSWKFCKYQFVNSKERDVLLEDENNFIFEFRSSLQYEGKEKDSESIDYSKNDYLNMGIIIYSGIKQNRLSNVFGLCYQTIQQSGFYKSSKTSFYPTASALGSGLDAKIKVKNLEDFYKYMSPYFTAYLYRMQYKLDYYLNLEENSNARKKVKSEDYTNQEMEIIKKADFYLLNTIDSSSIEYLHIACDIPKEKIHMVNEIELKKIIDAQAPNAIIAFDGFSNYYVTTLTNGRMIQASILLNNGEYTKEQLENVRKYKEKQEKKKKK